MEQSKVQAKLKDMADKSKINNCVTAVFMHRNSCHSGNILIHMRFLLQNVSTARLMW